MLLLMGFNVANEPYEGQDVDHQEPEVQNDNPRRGSDRAHTIRLLYSVVQACCSS